MADRAARFSPFAAITGYEEMVVEAARETQPRIELDESRKAVLDERMRQSVGRWVRITHFVPDRKKEGGTYVTTEATLTRIDGYRRELILDNGMKLEIDNLFDIEK